MRKVLYIIGMLTMLLTSCKEDDINVFDKTADERVAEAIAALKQDLIAPANGWKLKYTPEAESGSFYVLLDFNENDKVTIKTDLGSNDGAYYEQTISYRIDNSLGLELILENYSFFSFLFELDQATFGAEYEFNFINKTPDNALVFNSKSDISIPTILVFQEATAADINLLGINLSKNLTVLSDDLDKFTSSLKLTYENKDLALYISLDELRRTMRITSAALKTNSQNTQTINFTTGYLIKGDSIIFNEPFRETVLGNSIIIKSIQLNTLSDAVISVCPNPIPIHTYSGITSANDVVLLETSLIDVNGKSFASLSNFYFSPLQYIFDNGTSARNAILQDIRGALEMHLYYNYDPLDTGTPLYGIGFVIQNLNDSITFALRKFTPVLNDNNIIFNFAPDITLFGSQQTDDATIANINIYLDALTEGDNTYVFEVSEDLYEFYNPCTGWSFVFINANR